MGVEKAGNKMNRIIDSYADTGIHSNYCNGIDGYSHKPNECIDKCRSQNYGENRKKSYSDRFKNSTMHRNTGIKVVIRLEI